MSKNKTQRRKRGRTKKIKRRVIQNLYNACASVGIMGGLTSRDAEVNTVNRFIAGGTSKSMNVTFMGGIHGKVY